jgi:hypothetical protein
VASRGRISRQLEVGSHRYRGSAQSHVAETRIQRRPDVRPEIVLGTILLGALVDLDEAA